MNTTKPTSLNSKPTPWLTKFGFWFLWTFIHALGGAFGLLIGELVIRSNVVGSLSAIVGFVLFEGILGFFKHITFRFYKAMEYIRGIDMLMWIFAGLAILFSMLSGENAEGEITSISLNLLRIYGFLITSLVLTSQIPRFFNAEANQKRKLWFSRAKEHLEGRPFLKLISLPILILVLILLYVLVCSIGLALIALSFLIVLAPIGYSDIAFQNPVEVTEIIRFGLINVGWIGFISGLCYLLSFPKGLTLLVEGFKGKRSA